MERVGKLVSIQVGRPKEQVFERPQDGRESVWTSGIHKVRVDGPIMLRETNLDGDTQADLENHGGPYRAVLMYSADHYEAWPHQLKLAGIEGSLQGEGAFGENFTVTGFTEDTVCLGDILRIGEVVVQVSQPRRPCWKLGRRHNMPGLPAAVERLGWTGWYIRVLQTGFVEAGMNVEFVDRLYPQWTIRETARVMRDRSALREQATVLAVCEELSPDWRQAFRETAEARAE